MRFDPAANHVGLLPDCDGGCDRVLDAVDRHLVAPPSASAVRRESGRAFCAWLLADPVHRYPDCSPNPLRPLARASEYCSETVRANPSYNRSLGRKFLRVRDDSCWIVQLGAVGGYQLGELAEHVPRNWRMPSPSRVASFEGRNCTLFLLCRFAGSGAGKEADLSAWAHGLNAAFSTPLPGPEVAHVVKHVEACRARWEANGWHRPSWIERQRRRGRKGGLKGGREAGRLSGPARAAAVAERNRRVPALLGEGLTQREAGERVGLHQTTVSRIAAASRGAVCTNVNTR